MTLAGATVLVTRARGEIDALSDALEAEGARVIACPTLSFSPPSDPARFAAAVADAARADWLVFTSANGVRAFLDALAAARIDVVALAAVKIAAVGTATAGVLAAAGLEVALCPDEHRGEALAAELVQRGVSRRRILLLRAEEAREVLPRELSAAGALVEDVAAYRSVVPATLAADIRNAVASGGIDFVSFASPSAVRNFLAHIDADDRKRLLARAQVAVIGPVTEETAIALGLNVAVRATPYTAAALVEAIGAAWNAAGKGS